MSKINYQEEVNKANDAVSAARYTLRKAREAAEQTPAFIAAYDALESARNKLQAAESDRNTYYTAAEKSEGWQPNIAGTAAVKEGEAREAASKERQAKAKQLAAKEGDAEYDAAYAAYAAANTNLDKAIAKAGSNPAVKAALAAHEDARVREVDGGKYIFKGEKTYNDALLDIPECKAAFDARAAAAKDYYAAANKSVMAA